MRKKILSAVLCLGLVLGLLPTAALAAPGDSASDPVLISTAEELAAFALSTEDYTGKYVKLTADIDLSTVCGAGVGDWTPIGNNTDSFNGFCGTFDGDGHTIRNLYIHSGTGAQGLFGQIGAAGTVKNLTVTGRLDSGSPVGGIVGENYGRVENCDNECTIETTGISGGIVGQNEGVVENCRNAGTVVGKEAGGIVGRHRDGTVRDCDNTGVISCKYVDSTNPLDTIRVYVGGIVGTASSSKPVVERCYNAGPVEADAGTPTGNVNLFIGGVAGENLGTIQNCYNTVSVTVSEFSCAGGVVGNSMSGSTVKNCYGFGSISASGYVGGVIGRDWGSTITSSYYDTSKDTEDWQANGTGITTADFANQDTFDGWDFDAVWAMDPAQGRPVFQRQLTPSQGESHSHAIGVDCSAGTQAEFAPLSVTAGDLTAGNYYLAEDVTLTGTLSVPADSQVNLCLNGHVLDLDGENRLTVFGALTLCDCNGDGLSHKFSVDSQGLWTLDETNGTKTVTGGVITGLRPGRELDPSGYGKTGAAVTLQNGGSLTLYGGNLCGNKGGAVDAVAPDTAIAMYGGKISGNLGELGSALYPATDSARPSVLAGGEISENVCLVSYGGAVYVGGDNLQLSGSIRISGNSCLKDGALTPNDLCIRNDLGKAFTVTGALGGDVSVGLKGTQLGVLGKSGEGYTITGADLEKFHFFNDQYALRLTDGNEIEVYKPDGHVHRWATAWEKDETHHWHVCTAGGCTLTESSRMDGYAPHAYSGWQSDDTRHWQVCADCGYETAGAGHTWDGGSVTTLPTAGAGGELTYTCTACSATRTEAIPKLGSASGVVEVKPDTPEVTVDETALQDVAEAEKEDNKSVTVTLTVEAVEAPADKADIEAVVTQGQTVEYLDLALTKTTVDGNGSTTAPIADTGDTVLEIAVPFDFTRKTDVTAYRKHGADAAAALTKADSKADGTFRLDEAGGRVYIYASKFSTYAIGYTPVQEPSRPSTGSSGTTTYPPVIEQPEHGKITVSPTRPERGDKVVITVTPEAGYTVERVTVTNRNGKNVEVTVNEDGTYSFTQPAGKVTLSAALVEELVVCPMDETCPIHAFTDASTTAWYHDGVHYCLEKGLMEGYGDGKFAPNDPLSRAMLAQILYNQAGRPAVTGSSPFADVAPEDWYSGAVTWAAGQGIVEGYGDGNFGPNDPITREQLAAMLWRYAQGASGSGTLSAFTDADTASGWAVPALQWAVEQGILTGKGGGILDPTGSATRAEAATMLQRFCKNGK